MQKTEKTGKLFREMAATGTNKMDFESFKKTLPSIEAEEVQTEFNDIYNIHCTKDGDYINTIQIIEDEEAGQRIISQITLVLLQRAIDKHRIEHDESNYQVSIYEDVTEPARRDGVRHPISP